MRWLLPQLLSLLLLLECLALTLAIAAAAEKKSYKFALVGKQTNSPFFEAVYHGCKDRANFLSQQQGQGSNNIITNNVTITCQFNGTINVHPNEQVKIIQDLIDSGDIDGISYAVLDETIAPLLVDRAAKANVALITFDSDAPHSGRRAFVGTDNYRFGYELGKLLKQLQPHGGKYGILGAESPNLKLRIQGIRDNLRDSAWEEIKDGSPKYHDDLVDIAQQKLWEFVRSNSSDINAIVSISGNPMWNETGWKEFVDANRQLTLICGDSLPSQLDLINKGFVNALVGQLPYKMGEMSVDVLLDIVQNKFNGTDVLYGTEFLEILLFPLNLPPVYVNHNYLGELVYMSYLFFGTVTLLVIMFVYWTLVNRKDRVVVASQPPFLYMICLGALIMSSTLIPLTFDDNTYSQTACNRACMSIPWLASVGFTTTFAALFSKLWRVNRIFHNPNRFRRVKVEAKDVLLPYAVLMIANLIVLITWTLVEPIDYVRHDDDGTDAWNRVISTYGVCETPGDGNSTAYLVCLGVINLGVLVMANYQAYESRTVSTEFAESRYIGIIMASLLQAFIVGLPIVFLIRTQPRTYFVIFSILVFITCVVVLTVMFLPKIFHLRNTNKSKLRASQRLPATTSMARSEEEGGLRVKVHAIPTISTFTHHVHITGIDYPVGIGGDCGVVNEVDNLSAQGGDYASSGHSGGDVEEPLDGGENKSLEEDGMEYVRPGEDEQSQGDVLVAINALSSSSVLNQNHDVKSGRDVNVVHSEAATTSQEHAGILDDDHSSLRVEAPASQAFVPSPLSP